MTCSIKFNECIILGKCNKEDEVEIVRHKSLEDIDKNEISRNLENFEWNDKFQIVYFDFDGSGENDLTPDEFISVVSEIIPQFKNVTKIVKYSSSAHVYKGDELLSKHNGFHIYFLVNHPEKIKEIFKGDGCWLAKKL